MFKVGDKIKAKMNFLTDLNVPLQYREFKITNLEKGIATIDNCKMNFTCIADQLPNYFYFNNYVNHELLQLIEHDKVEFVSFKGVTADGKVIEIRTT